MIPRETLIFSSERIKACRTRKGYTRKEVSELTDHLYSEETIHRWETDRIPSRLEPLVILADALGCTIKDFASPDIDLRMKGEHLPVNIEDIKSREVDRISRLK